MASGSQQEFSELRNLAGNFKVTKCSSQVNSKVVDSVICMIKGPTQRGQKNLSLQHFAFQWDGTRVQGGWGGWPTGNGKKLSYSQACCLAQLCLAAA